MNFFGSHRLRLHDAARLVLGGNFGDGLERRGGIFCPDDTPSVFFKVFFKLQQKFIQMSYRLALDIRGTASGKVMVGVLEKPLRYGLVVFANIMIDFLAML